MVGERTFEAFALAGAVLAVLATEARRSAAGTGGHLHRHDQVDWYDDLVGEARSSEPRLPDPGLCGEHESCTSHDVAERWSIGEQAWVEHDVGIGGERLVGGKPVGGSQVNRLRSDGTTASSCWLRAPRASRSTRLAGQRGFRGPAGLRSNGLNRDRSFNTTRR